MSHDGMILLHEILGSANRQLDRMIARGHHRTWKIREVRAKGLPITVQVERSGTTQVQVDIGATEAGGFRHILWIKCFPLWALPVAAERMH